LAWVGAGAIVVLAARALAYALSPSPLARTFEHRAGGPALPFVVVGALVLGVGLAAAVVGLAALGVRERSLLESAARPRLRLRRLAARAAALFVAASLGFALLESWLHWRAGLGWHGLDCLIGPAHRNAIPLLAALSLVASALAAALDHVLAWMRRTIARLRVRFAPIPLPVLFAPLPARPARISCASLRARGPPGARHVPGTC
jgi:hypothetical protein